MKKAEIIAKKLDQANKSRNVADKNESPLLQILIEAILFILSKIKDLT